MKIYSLQEIKDIWRKYKAKKCLECDNGEIVRNGSSPNGGWVSYYKCTSCKTEYEWQESDREQSEPDLRSNADENGSFLFNKKLIEKAITNDKPCYTIGVDIYDKNNLAYCLSKKVGDTVEVILSKVIREETEFRQEVENLAKYFDANIFANRKNTK
jgi:hypothetical protein